MTIKKRIFSLVKIITDILMTVLFLLLMGYHLFENVMHEWLGASLFVLFLLHNALNFRWYKNLFKGKYTALRILFTVTDFLLWIFMILNIASAIMISRDVFVFLGLSGGSAGRIIHLFATIWSFLLISFHIGLHFQTVVNNIKDKAKLNKKALIAAKWTVRIILLAVCVYGAVVFIKRELYSDMFLLSEFKFMDFGESKLKFFADYICVLTLFAAIGYYLKLFITTNNKRQKSERLN